MHAKLDEPSHRDVILTTILLKPGKRNFKIGDFQSGLKRCSNEYPRLKISQHTIENVFLIYHPYLCGQLDIPEYCLGREGRRIVQKEFDNYDFSLQKELQTIAEKVWASNSPPI